MDILFPSGFKCLVCGKEIEKTEFELCDKCFSKLPKINSKVCLKCGEPIFDDGNYCVFCKKEMPSFTKCLAPFTYDEPITTLIYRLKYSGEKYIANTLSNLILKHFLESGLKCDVVIPVPLFISRESKRGFNQSELLVQSFKSHKFNVDCSCVVRTKNTTTQTSLTKTERQTNVEDAFLVLKKTNVKDKNILVVDDVYTTGSTFNAISKVLFKAGAKNVYGLSVAHTVIDKK